MPNPQLHPQLRQQGFEPPRVPAGFHPHSHRLARQPAVKLFRFAHVLQAQSPILSSFRIHHCDSLKTRVIITAYNPHVGSFSRALVVQRQPMYSDRSRSRHTITKNAKKTRKGRKETEIRPRPSNSPHHEPPAPACTISHSSAAELPAPLARIFVRGGLGRGLESSRQPSAVSHQEKLLARDLCRSTCFS